jgi:magnesium chelatase accessory protein
MSTTAADVELEARDRPHGQFSRVVDHQGFRWHVQIMGSGPVMLLLHGTGASSHSFRDLMPLLAPRFTVVAPDLPGHAATRMPSWFEPSLDGMATALGGLLTALDLSPEIAVGHSAGAALVARMTLDGVIAPRLLVGLGAAIYPLRGVARALLPRTARLLSLASKVIDLSVRDTVKVERLLRSTGSALDRGGVELYRQLSERPEHVSAVLAMMASWELEPLFADLPRLDTRFLLLAGQTDRAVPGWQLRAVAARCPRARLVVVPHTGHLLHEEQPGVIARLIFEEIAAHCPSPAPGAAAMAS